LLVNYETNLMSLIRPRLDILNCYSKHVLVPDQLVLINSSRSLQTSSVISFVISLCLIF